MGVGYVIRGFGMRGYRKRGPMWHRAGAPDLLRPRAVVVLYGW